MAVRSAGCPLGGGAGGFPGGRPGREQAQALLGGAVGLGDVDGEGETGSGGRLQALVGEGEVADGGVVAALGLVPVPWRRTSWAPQRVRKASLRVDSSPTRSCGSLSCGSRPTSVRRMATEVSAAWSQSGRSGGRRGEEGGAGEVHLVAGAGVCPPLDRTGRAPRKGCTAGTPLAGDSLRAPGAGYLVGVVLPAVRWRWGGATVPCPPAAAAQPSVAAAGVPARGPPRAVRPPYVRNPSCAEQ